MCVLVVMPSHRSEERSLVAKSPEDNFSFILRQSHFDHAYESMRFEEGYYAWFKEDFGGETYGGITRNFNKQWSGWRVIDSVKIAQKKKWALDWNQRVDPAEPHVKEFYRGWWNDWNMDIIQDSLAAVYTFDFAICGAASIKIIQKTLNSFGNDFKINGKMSTDMAEAINQLDPVIYAESLRLNRRAFYLDISQKWHRVKDSRGRFKRDSTGHYVRAQTQKVFLRGWLIRADRVRPVIKRRLLKPTKVEEVKI